MMMKANELRIGNWVHEPVIGYCQIEVIEYNNCLVGDSSDTAYNILLTGLEPIPLTPEILIACGFEKDISSQYGGYLISIGGEGEKIRIINDEIVGWHWPLHGYQRPIAHYLHQLQNLYFALTGEELDINL